MMQSIDTDLARTLRVPLLLVATLTLFAPTALAQPATDTAKNKEDAAIAARVARLGDKVKRKNLPAKEGAQKGFAEGVLNVPVERVIKEVTTYKKYVEFMPHFKKSKVLSKRGNNALLYLEVDILKGSATLWTNAKIYERKAKGKTRIFEARMIKGKGNMSRFLARWEVTPVDAKRTLVDFTVMVDPDLPVPDSLISDQNKKAASSAVKALKKRLQRP